MGNNEKSQNLIVVLIANPELLKIVLYFSSLSFVILVIIVEFIVHITLEFIVQIFNLTCFIFILYIMYSIGTFQ